MKKKVNLLRKTLMKLAVLAFVLVLPLVGTTNAVFYDQESSLSNNFSAGSLDFSLRDTSNVVLTSPFFNLSGFKPGDSQAKTLRVKKDGALDFKYDGRFVKTAGEDNFCQALQLEAKLGVTTKYSGNLDGFTLAPALTIDGGGQDDWEFKISLNDNNPLLQGQNCQFNFIFKGWQVDSDGTWGFVDEEILTNTVSSGTWSISPPSPGAGSVVINELMWMGSVGNSYDEWIELRNTTEQEINLSGWQLTKWVAGTHEELMLTIPSGKTIPAHGYFLISNLNEEDSAISVEPNLVDLSVVLTNSSLRIKLYKGAWTDSGNLIDTADDGSGTPLAGVDSTNRQSMERNDNPATGWHTCDNNACNDATYWDTEGYNYGTPKAANLSGEDTSTPGPSLEFGLRHDKRAVYFKAKEIKEFSQLSYEIIYDTDGEDKGMAGKIELSGENAVDRHDLTLGTCSTLGKVCVYDTGITKITLKVILTLPNGETTEIVKEIAY